MPRIDLSQWPGLKQIAPGLYKYKGYSIQGDGEWWYAYDLRNGSIAFPTERSLTDLLSLIRDSESPS